MPQLDRYLVTSEIFWFLIFFIVSFFSVYYFLKLIFEGSRFRNLFILGKTQQILKLKAERHLSSGLILRTMENFLLQTTQLQKDIQFRSKQISLRDRFIRKKYNFSILSPLAPAVMLLHLKKLSIKFLFEYQSSETDA
jgi:hypothetical protein